MKYMLKPTTQIYAGQELPVLKSYLLTRMLSAPAGAFGPIVNGTEGGMGGVREQGHWQVSVHSALLQKM